jgi:hypothetical protein
MRIGRSILMAVVALALAAYGIDCPATSTPDEAMQCCDSMPCSPHGHDSSQDCCKTMQATHAPFVKQSSSQGAHFSPVLCELVPSAGSSQGLDFAADLFLATLSHAPPISPPAVLSPLRI